MLGKAMDFYIPGVPLKKLRDTGLRMQVGGVGYYPRSGSPFVHLDVGNVRHWPRMSRKELVAVFPNGKTLHVPSDGKPLPGFETALASYQSRKKSGTTALALAASRRNRQVRRAAFGAVRRRRRRGRGQWRGRGEGSRRGGCRPPSPKPSGDIRIVPPELANPASAACLSEEAVDETPETIIAALPARDIPLPVFAPRPAGRRRPSGCRLWMQRPHRPDSIPFGMAEVLPRRRRR